MTPKLPPGAWEVVFPRAPQLVDEIQRFGGFADPFWTFGGRTVWMFRYGHRLSRDIDIVVPDPQHLGYRPSLAHCVEVASAYLAALK